VVFLVFLWHIFPETRFYLIDVIAKKKVVQVVDALELKNVKAEQFAPKM
jgi:hypothetical protein